MLEKLVPRNIANFEKSLFEPQALWLDSNVEYVMIMQGLYPQNPLLNDLSQFYLGHIMDFVVHLVLYELFDDYPALLILEGLVVPLHIWVIQSHKRMEPVEKFV